MKIVLLRNLGIFGISLLIATACSSRNSVAEPAPVAAPPVTKVSATPLPEQAPSVAAGITVDTRETIERFPVGTSSPIVKKLSADAKKRAEKYIGTPLEKYISEMEDMTMQRFNERFKAAAGAVQYSNPRYTLSYQSDGSFMGEMFVSAKCLGNRYWTAEDGSHYTEDPNQSMGWRTWNSGDISRYGAYQKYQTLEAKDKRSFESKKLLSTDNVYAQIITVALQICDTTDYNWAGYSAYKGATPIPTPGKILAVCEGYAKAGQSAFLKLACVESVENWSVPGKHEWNVLNLSDGRKLFVDVTWFDNDHIDEKTGKTTYADDYDWENITFDEALFDHGRLSYTLDFTHASPSKQLESRVSRD